MFDSIGTFGEWAGAAASAAGVLISIWALNVSKKAEQDAKRLSEESNAAVRAQHAYQQALEREREDRLRQFDEWSKERAEFQERLQIEQRRREEASEIRNVARLVAAWWVKNDADEWGLLISNDGQSAGTVHDIRIEVGCKYYKKETLRMNTLPPGNFFVESLKETDDSGVSGWDYPRFIKDIGGFSSILNSAHFKIDKISFSDSSKTRWIWTPERGLTKSSKSTLG
ncbi:phage protein [Corynebacterium jeikeium]|uniref:hypothetical protein n=1 Tax=Corynebacterium jeikeium TaxID=38289 RepID=UPI000E1300A3|nr:hypothetical protein [Corynebacterium jeikeium]SUY85594.1 phage protein [Corynebacterium jeikeium]